MRKFIEADQSQALLLPPDLREWIPSDDLAHFVLEAVERVDMSRFRVNERRTLFWRRWSVWICRVFGSMNAVRDRHNITRG
jgi:hypothetical protein